MLDLSGIAPELLRDLGQAARLEWPTEDSMSDEVVTAVTLETFTFISQNKVWNGNAVVSQLEALLPATERSVQGAYLWVGARRYTIQSVAEIGGVGPTAAIQIAVIA